MVFVIIFVLALVVFFIFGIRYMTRERRIAWSGELIDKYQFEQEEISGDVENDSRGRIYTVYMLKLKLDNGKTHEVAVSKDFYNEVKIGDKLKKDLGTSRPTKI